MSNYVSVAARVPAEHKEALEKVLSLLVNDNIVMGVGLANSTHPEFEDYAVPPATHYAMNNEGTPLDFMAKVSTIQNGIGNGIDDVLPDVQWGTGGLPTKEQAIAAIAAADLFQRNSQTTTTGQHFRATCGQGSPQGLKPVLDE